MSIWAMFGAISIPILVAIYFFRDRYPKKVVSSLLLWNFPELKMKKGNQRKTFVSERSFWLELLVLLLMLFLLLEIALPFFQTQKKIIYVLDNRYSLLAEAKNKKPVYQNIVEEILAEVKPQQNISIILADQVPKTVLINSAEKAEVESVLRQWKPEAMTFDWHLTKVMLMELADTDTQIILYTDRDLKDTLLLNQCELRKRGERQSNYAVISGSFAESSKGKNQARLQFIVKGFLPEDSLAKDTLTATVKQGETNFTLKGVKQKDAPLYFFETSSLVSELAVDIEIKTGDVLTADDQIHFEPPAKRILKVSLQVKEPELAQLMQKTLALFPNLRITDVQPHLVISDSFLKDSSIPQILLGPLESLDTNKGNNLYGELIVEKKHPFLKDTNLQNLTWINCKKIITPQHVVASQKEFALMGEILIDSRKVFFLNMDLLASNWKDRQDWPIFWDNVYHYYMEGVEGLCYTTLLGGGQNYFITRAHEIEVYDTRQQVTKFTPISHKIELASYSDRGMYRIYENQKKVAQFYVNYFDLEGMNLLQNENQTKMITTDQNKAKAYKIAKQTNAHTIVVILLLLATGIYCFNLYLEKKEH